MIFFNKRYEVRDNRKYLVLEPILKSHYIHLVLLFIMMFFVATSRNNFFINLFGGIFLLGLIFQFIESWPIVIARYIKRKEVINRGGLTIFDIKNPPETWVEQ